MQKNTRFVLVCIVLFAIGAGLRLTAPDPISPAPVAAMDLQPAAAPATAEPVPLDVSATVLNFYHAVDKGDYASAYALALENHWSPAEDGTLRVDALATQDEFVSMLADELGANGMSLNIIAIEAQDEAFFIPTAQDMEDLAELQTLEFLPTGAPVTELYRVRLAGTLLGRCSRWDWSKHVLVAEVEGEGWRVLLPGMKGPFKPHHEEWFLDRTPQAG